MSIINSVAGRGRGEHDELVELKQTVLLSSYPKRSNVGLPAATRLLPGASFQRVRGRLDRLDRMLLSSLPSDESLERGTGSHHRFP